MNVSIMIQMDEAYKMCLQKLVSMPQKIPKVLKGAINDTAKYAKKLDDKEAKATYTDKGDIHPLRYTAATTGNLTAWLRDSGANVSMTHYRYRAGKTRVSATINTKHGNKVLGKNGNKAFFNGTIYVRKGKSRLPIEKMFSISSPVQHGNPQVWDPLEPGIQSKFMENVSKRIEAAL